MRKYNITVCGKIREIGDIDSVLVEYSIVTIIVLYEHN